MFLLIKKVINFEDMQPYKTILLLLSIVILTFVSLTSNVFSSDTQCNAACGSGSCKFAFCPSGTVGIGNMDCNGLYVCCCPNMCGTSGPLSGTNYVCRQDGAVGGTFDCLVNDVSTGSRTCSAPDICKGSKVGGWPCQASCGAQGQSCCSGNTCNSGLTCQSGICNPAPTCGAQDQPCCSGNINQCNSGLTCQSGTCKVSGGQVTCTCDHQNQQTLNNGFHCSDSSKNAFCSVDQVCTLPSSQTWIWPNYPCAPSSGTSGYDHYLSITVTDVTTGQSLPTMEKPDYMGGQRCSSNRLQINSGDQVRVDYVLYNRDGTRDNSNPTINLDVGNCGAAGGGAFRNNIRGGSVTLSQSDLTTIFQASGGSSLFLNYKDSSGKTLGTSAEAFLQLPSGGTTGNCTNPHPSSSGTDTYGVRLCRSDYNSCSWSGTDNVQVSAADANGNIQVTFTSQSATAVNIWVTNGRIIQVNSNYMGLYGYFILPGICDNVNTADECIPSLLVNDGAGNNFASNLGSGFIASASSNGAISLNNPVRALMPLNFDNRQAAMTIVPSCIVQGGDCTNAPNIILYYQLYYDTGTNAGVSSWCDATAGNLCSAQHASYTGCTGNVPNTPGQPDNIFTNSEICIRSGSGAVAGNACWHYPWEIYPNLWTPLSISSQGATSSTSSTSSTSTTSISPISTSSTTSTTSSTSTSSTSSTTTTTPTIQPLILTCPACYANSACSCSISSNSCNNGAWFAKNLNSNPLPQINITTIPPYTVYFYPNQTGTVNATAQCFDIFPNNRTNSTTVTVQNPFLVCPSTCAVNSACTCTVNNCNSGLFLAVFNNTALSTQPFSTNPYTATFTPTQIGTVSAIATCDNPLLPSVKANIQIVGIGNVTTTTTTQIISGSFTHSGFRCVQGGNRWTCTINYNNQAGQSVFIFYDLFNAGKRTDSKSSTVNTGSGVSSVIFDCVSEGPGTYSVTVKAYLTETRANPIDWSTTSETQTITC
jgi:hypothetical protein